MSKTSTIEDLRKEVEESLHKGPAAWYEARLALVKAELEKLAKRWKVEYGFGPQRIPMTDEEEDAYRKHEKEVNDLIARVWGKG